MNPVDCAMFQKEQEGWRMRKDTLMAFGLKESKDLGVWGLIFKSL